MVVPAVNENASNFWDLSMLPANFMKWKFLFMLVCWKLLIWNHIEFRSKSFLYPFTRRNFFSILHVGNYNCNFFLTWNNIFIPDIQVAYAFSPLFSWICDYIFRTFAMLSVNNSLTCSFHVSWGCIFICFLNPGVLAQENEVDNCSSFWLLWKSWDKLMIIFPDYLLELASKSVCSRTFEGGLSFE